MTAAGNRKKAGEQVDPLLRVLRLVHPFDLTLAVEQFVYFLLLRSLSDEDAIMRRLDSNYISPFIRVEGSFRWEDIRAADDCEIIQCADRAISSLHEMTLLSYSARHAFRGARLVIGNPLVLRSVIRAIDFWDFSVPGAAKALFQQLTNFIGRTESHFRTPQHIAESLMKLVQPKIGERVFDAMCGAGDLLLAAFRQMTSQPVNSDWLLLEQAPLTGVDADPISVKLAAANLYVHGLDTISVSLRSNSATSSTRFDVVIADLMVAGAARHFRRIVDLLPRGRRGGVIVPRALIEGAELTAALASCRIDAIVTLPPRVYAPYSNNGVAFVLFSKRSAKTHTWSYDVLADGYSLDGRRLPIPSNDLPHMLERWQERRVDDGLVPLSEFTEARGDYVDASSRADATDLFGPWRSLEEVELKVAAAGQHPTEDAGKPTGSHDDLYLMLRSARQGKAQIRSERLCRSDRSANISAVCMLCAALPERSDSSSATRFSASLRSALDTCALKSRPGLARHRMAGHDLEARADRRHENLARVSMAARIGSDSTRR